jgi:hypothetical protein
MLLQVLTVLTLLCGCCGTIFSGDDGLYSLQSLIVQNTNITDMLATLQVKLSRNCQGILNAGLSKGNGVYTIYPNGAPMQVYCDMASDDGGWTLVGKASASIDGTPIRNDAGFNYLTGLQSLSFSEIAVMPRVLMANLGLSYRVLSSDGTRRFYWEGQPPYFKDRHYAQMYANMKLSYAGNYLMACTGAYASHSLAIFDSSCDSANPHIVLQRYCCGPFNGIWWNGGAWSPGSYTDGSVWIR